MRSFGFRTLCRTRGVCRSSELSTTQHVVKLAQVVETHFRSRPSRLRSGAEITPYAVTDPVLRHSARLFLDTLQRGRKIIRAQLELHRVDTREPAHRTRHVNIS